MWCSYLFETILGSYWWQYLFRLQLPIRVQKSFQKVASSHKFLSYWYRPSDKQNRQSHRIRNKPHLLNQPPFLLKYWLKLALLKSEQPYLSIQCQCSLSVQSWQLKIIAWSRVWLAVNAIVLNVLSSFIHKLRF